MPILCSCAVNSDSLRLYSTAVLSTEMTLNSSPNKRARTKSDFVFTPERWHKQDDSLDEEDETEVVHTLQSLKGTDLLAQYKAQLSQEERVHQKLLQAIDKAETEEQEGETTPRFFSGDKTETTAHSLDYYL